jgi:hypothetical protein
MTVFLSYGHKDAPTAKALAADLEELIGAVWLDESLSGGQRWWDEILRQIRECSLFVLAVSRHSLSSEACLAESSYALSLERPLLAVRIGNVDLLSAPPAIRSTQLIDYAIDDAASIKGLARAVMRTTAPGPLPIDMPPEPPIPQSYRDRFSALFGRDLSMDQQLDAFTRLKMDVDDDEKAEDALELLRHLYERPDTGWKLRADIERLIGEPRRPQGEQPPPERRSDGQPLPVPGWYLDPTRRFELRYWDGRIWTQHVGRGGHTFLDPLHAT